MAAAKRVSAFDRALIEAQLPSPSSEVLERIEEAEEITDNSESAPAAPVVEAAANVAETNASDNSKKKMGRPKGAAKTKKTFYLTSGGIENLKASQIALVKRAGLFIKDESEVADLAIALLNAMLLDDNNEGEEGLKRILEIYNKSLSSG
ncbi:MAG: hypothetical protein HXX20_19580 [Chloroflexi bacterium]|nr:hypothetical protein [Chloroflexota bacterium]